MSSPPDISDLILQIIERLGLKPTDVRTITFDATLPGVIVTEYLLDSDGKKYLDHNYDVALKATWMPATTRPTLDLETAAKPASLTADRVPPMSVPAGLQRSTAGTATLKGANLRHDVETETTTTTVVEQPPEPEPQPEPDEPDTDDDESE